MLLLQPDGRNGTQITETPHVQSAFVHGRIENRRLKPTADNFFFILILIEFDNKMEFQNAI